MAADALAPYVARTSAAMILYNGMGNVLYPLKTVAWN